MGTTSSRSAAGSQVAEQLEGKGQHAIKGQQKVREDQVELQQPCGSTGASWSADTRRCMQRRTSSTLFSRLQVPFEDVCFVKQIGKGASKTVYLGTWAGTQVAVCSLRRGGRMMEVHSMAQLVQAGVLSHPNLVQFYRWCGDAQGNEYLVMEYVQLGGLDRLLRASGSYLQLTAKVSIAEQICSAMCVLMEAGILHKDLSTRNVLVHTLNPVHIKVADFGPPGCGTSLSPQQGTSPLSHDDGANDLLPMRWCPPEVLLRSEWSEKSDVWAYGVTLWEVFANGAEPYAPLSDEQVVKQVLQHKLLPWPEGCPIQMYRLMLLCWASDPQDRPKFSEIAQLFKYWRAVGSHWPGKRPVARTVSQSVTAPAGGQPASSSRQNSTHSGISHHPATDERNMPAPAEATDTTAQVYGPCAVLVPGPPPDWVRPYDAPGTYIQPLQQQQELKPSRLEAYTEQLQGQQQAAATSASNSTMLLAHNIADLMDDCMAQYFAPANAYIQPHISRSSQCMYQTIVLNPNAQGSMEQPSGRSLVCGVEQQQQDIHSCMLAHPPLPAAPTAAVNGSYRNVPCNTVGAVAQLARVIADTIEQQDALSCRTEHEHSVDSGSSWETADSHWETTGTALYTHVPPTAEPCSVQTPIAMSSASVSEAGFCDGARASVRSGNSTLVSLLHEQLCKAQQLTATPSLHAEKLLQAAGMEAPTICSAATMGNSSAVGMSVVPDRASSAAQEVALHAGDACNAVCLSKQLLAPFTAADVKSASSCGHKWLVAATQPGSACRAEKGNAGPVDTSGSHSSSMASSASEVVPSSHTHHHARGMPSWPLQMQQAVAATTTPRGSGQVGLVNASNSIAALTFAATNACWLANPTLLAAVAEYQSTQRPDKLATSQQHMASGKQRCSSTDHSNTAASTEAGASVPPGMYQRPRQVLSCAPAVPAPSKSVAASRSTSSGYMSVHQLQEVCKQLSPACRP